MHRHPGHRHLYPDRGLQGLHLDACRARVGTTGDAVLLTEDAIVNSVAGPYHVTTIRTSGATGVTTVSSSSFNFGGAGGGGIQTPKASIVAYIADKTPNRPSGLTADGQNSDANTAPSVSILPGTTKVSLVVKNTGMSTRPVASSRTRADMWSPTFRPSDANFTGTAPSVRYEVSDELGNTVGATVTVAVKSVAPKADADSATTPVRTPVTIDVLANDSAGSAAVPLVASSLVLIDGNGNAVTTLSVSGGTYSVVGGKVVFTPECRLLRYRSGGDVPGLGRHGQYRQLDGVGRCHHGDPDRPPRHGDHLPQHLGHGRCPRQ